MGDWVGVLSVALAIGLLLWVRALRARRRAAHSWKQTQLPAGQLVSADLLDPSLRCEGLVSPDLHSRRYGLRGRPDRVLRTDDGYIPVDLKNKGRPPSGIASESHQAQVAVYCLLVEDCFGSQVPYALIQYQDGSVRVPFDDQCRQWILNTIEEVRQAKRLSLAPPRNHQHTGRCRACSFARSCAQSLEKSVPREGYPSR